MDAMNNFKICRDCGLAFVSIEDAASCPRCKDISQQRPSIVESRKALAIWEAVRVDGLPGQWEYFLAQRGDTPVYKMDVRGRKFGADWNGRIVIYAERPIEIGEVCRVRLMEAEHTVRTISLTQYTLEHGRVPVTKTIPVYETEHGELGTEIHRYMALEPMPDGEAQARLVWCEARTKTTIKGLGRQYASDTIIRPEPLFEVKIRGGVRSGRARTVGTLAVVSLDASVEVVSSEW